MKTKLVRYSLGALAAAGLLTASTQFACAQITAASNVPVSSPDGQPTEVHLSYGVPDVLKLSAAHVGDDAIIAYIGTTGTAYNLSVNEIVYLKNQGVSDRVLAAMLDQGKRLNATVTQTTTVTTPAPAPAPQAPSAAATSAASTSVYAGAPGTQFAPSVSQQTVYAQTAPASTVYVAPTTTYAYPASYPYYYSSYPYYGGYYGYGYGYPGVSLGIGIGFGGGWCGSGWYGGGCYRGWGTGCWGGWGGYRGGFCGGWRGGGFCRR